MDLFWNWRDHSYFLIIQHFSNNFHLIRDIIRVILTRYWIISMTISIVEQFNGEVDVSSILGGKRREKFIGDEDLRFTW